MIILSTVDRTTVDNSKNDNVLSTVDRSRVDNNEHTVDG